MFSILLRSTKNPSSIGHHLKQCRSAVTVQRHLQNYASFSLRELLHESSDEAGTLLTRFAKHVALEVQKCTSTIPTTIRYADYFPITDDNYFKDEVRRTPIEQLPALIIFASTYRPNAHPPKFVLVLNELDAAAVRNVNKMNEDTILRTLYALLFLIPNWITRCEFYRVATRKLGDSFTATSQKEKFVQLCFYLGLDKKNFSAEKNSHYLQHILDQYLEHHLPQLSTMDLAVVCSASYKTATAVKSNALKERLIEEVVSMTLDNAHDALLVTFLKTMRFERIHSENVCERLGVLCSSPQVLQQLQAPGLVHVFAYFAENSWDKAEYCEPLIKEFMNRLKRSLNDDSATNYMRAKDVGMFLWCCSQLNCTLSNEDLQHVEDFILKKVQNNEFRFFPDQLVDCTLSLWLLGYRSRYLMEHSVNIKSRQNQRQQRDQPKVESRLTVLLSAAAIEEPSWTNGLQVPRPFKENAEVPAYLIKKRPDMVSALKVISADESVQNAKFDCPIHGINILSISVQLKEPAGEKVYVELLTDEHTLCFSGEPVAIMRLKIRLLTALGYKVVVLNKSDVEENYRGLKEWAFEKPIEPSNEQSARSI